MSLDVIKRIGEAYANPPEGFTLHPRLKPQIDRRVAMASSGDVDWATAELFAFGATVMQGRAVRLAGQDSPARHVHPAARHADRPQHRRRVHPAAELSDDQAPFFAYDSLLSEYAAMGFEYGYSVVRDDALVCWEAQFGDFADGAQTIIDEFIASGEAKWGQRCAVTLLLPHGYEGQGPDHSSGRPERFLQLAAENNMTVAMCSSPANYFHLLRRQALSPVRRPLIAFTPKSLLRLKAAVSQVDEFTSGTFQPVLPDPGAGPRGAPGAAVQRQGLLRPGRGPREEQAHRRRDPPPRAALPAARGESCASSLDSYPDAELVWVQEEPANQGGYPFIALNLPEHLGGRPLLRVTAPGVGLAGGRLAVGARGAAARDRRHRVRLSRARSGTTTRRGRGREPVYFTDRGIEELIERRGEEEVSLEWLAGRLQSFVDLNPEFETAVERLATWLARDDEDD